MPTNRIGLNSFAAFLDQVSLHPGVSVGEIQLGSMSEALHYAAKHDFDFVEILLDYPLLGDADLEGLLQDVITDVGLPVNVHAPFIDLSISSHNTLVREASVRSTINAIAAAQSLKAACLTFHPGTRVFPFNLVRGHYSSAMQDSLRQILAAYPNPGLRVCVENMPTTERFFGRIADIQRILERPSFDAFYLTYDTSHLYTWGEDAAEFWVAFHDRIGNVHLVDNRYTDQDPHIALGKGHIDFHQVAGLLLQYAYPYDIVIELQTLHHCSRGRAFFLRLLESAANEQA